LKAILLAGGMGTRLRSVVKDVPKPMAPVAGRPFIEILLTNLVRQGVDEIVLAIGYRHDVITNYFGSSFHGVPLTYVIEDKPLGTGGALKLACQDAQEEHLCFVFNADTFVDVDLSAMYQSCLASQADVGMVLMHMDDVSRYGRVTLDAEETRVVQFEEKSRHEPGLVNMGVYLLKPSLFRRFDLPDACSLEHDLFIKQLGDITIRPWITDGYFIDIGIPDDYQRAQTEMLVYL